MTPRHHGGGARATYTHTDIKKSPIAMSIQGVGPIVTPSDLLPTLRQMPVRSTIASILSRKMALSSAVGTFNLYFRSHVVQTC